MASIIQGYEYDIFISYRQKDNKGERWVSEFVETLKTELESTFKEEISVYFDINPHDGLLETHDVGDSLKEKLKCLVFIPIISRTYCDPKSFAWEHEFKAFVDLASQDRFGLKVKLPGGNVASRVLPVRIHDLDTEDTKLCESVLGGVMRGVEFIYKEPGVNKPLTADDDEKKNLNGTKYRIQVNKVANAIQEIIQGLITEANSPLVEKTHEGEQLGEFKKEDRSKVHEEPGKFTRRKLLSGAVIISVLIIVLLAYPKIFSNRKSKIARDPDGKISIAVNPFDNLTGDTTLNTWQNGISELLIGNLGASNEISVQNSHVMYEVYESIEQTKNASVVPSISRVAAIKLNAGVYITGSFHKTANRIRIQLKLIDTKSDELLWTGKVDGNLNSDFIDLADSLSTKVKNFLEIKALEQNSGLDFKEAYTNSADAYRKYIEGMNSFMNEDYLSAIQSFKEALKFDSTFALATFFIAYSYNNNADNDPKNARYNYSQIKTWIQKAYRGKESLPANYQLWLEQWNAMVVTKNMEDVLTYNRLLENSDIKSRYYWYDIAATFHTLQKFDEAVKAFEKVEAINSEWGVDWKFVGYYIWFGEACHQTGLHKKETEIYETGLNLYPDNLWLLFYKTRCAISQEGDTTKTSKSVRKFIEVIKEMDLSSSQIESYLGNLYWGANSLDKAEEHFRLALKLNPFDSELMKSFASFLINTGRNVDEGMNLVKSLLKTSPASGTTLWVQGLGYYKQGKNEEALSLLNAAKDSSLFIYPNLDRQIQDVKKAIANQK